MLVEKHSELTGCDEVSGTLEKRLLDGILSSPTRSGPPRGMKMRKLRPSARRARKACFVAMVTTSRFAAADDNPTLDITDYDIPELEAAYASGTYTPVDALNFYLNRIATYDRSGPKINSVPVLNPTPWPRPRRTRT